MHIFYANLPLCVSCVRADFVCERIKDVAAKQEHPHTHRQFELCILDHCIVNFGVHGVSTALATSQGSSQAC